MRVSAALESKLVLNAKRIKKVDIGAALTLKAFIEKLDRKIFPRSPAPVRISLEKSRARYIAAYCHRPFDSYSIFVRNLNESLKKEGTIASWYLLVEKEGTLKPTRPARRLALETIMASVAAHEVRHRIQKHFRPCLFEPKHERELNSDLSVNIRYITTALFDIMKKGYKREKQRKKYVRHRINHSEFDAMTVEWLAHQLLQQKFLLEKIVPLLYTGVRRELL